MPDKLIAQIKAGDMVSPEVLKSAVVEMAAENERLRDDREELLAALQKLTGQALDLVGAVAGRSNADPSHSRAGV